MKLAGKRSVWLEYLVIFLGTGLMATAIKACFDACGLVTGGFSGAAILVKEWTRGIVENGVPLWVTNLSLNIPLFILATKLKGFSFVKKALVGDMTLTMWLAVLPEWKLSDDLLLSSVLWRDHPWCGNRTGISGRRNNRRNGHACRHYPEIYETLYHCPDHAVY